MPVCRIFDSTGKELTQCTTDVFLPHSKIFFGRSSQCQVCLKAFAESSISRQHFYIQESITGQWSIYDNDSHAGIHQNAKKIDTAPLYDGTIIRFGTLFFAFGEKGGPSHYRLKWTTEDGTTEFGYLWEGDNSVGASRDNYVTVRLGNVARFHANIAVRGSTLVLTPLNSFLETEVNGERIEGAKPINAGDTFTMNGFPVEVERMDFAARRAVVVMSEEEVSRRNTVVRQEKNTTLVVVYSLMAAGIMLLIGLVLAAVKWLPHVK